MRRPITPIVAIFVFFLVSGFLFITDSDQAQARSQDVEASIYLNGGDEATLFPDDDPDPGDRGTGDDDAPGETVKLEGSSCAPLSSGGTRAWFTLKTSWSWMFRF